MIQPELTAAEWNERERSLDVDINDARKAFNLARDHFDRLCEQRREMRCQRRQQIATVQPAPSGNTPEAAANDPYEGVCFAGTGAPAPQES